LRLTFAGMAVVAATAGGAWSPIGEDTTTVLRLGGQTPTAGISSSLFPPSLVCLLLPLTHLGLTLAQTSLADPGPGHTPEPVNGGKLMLILGIGALISVPIFKAVTHLPPYLGILFGLGILWVVSELIHPDLDEVAKRNYTVAGALSRVDVPSVLFFLGILLA